MKPLLTIAIPTFNRCDLLNLLIESIANQIGPCKVEVHVIVVDNYSSDLTQIYCQKWAHQFEWLTYIRNTENIGMSRNIIKCFDMTPSVFSWIIGDDDILRYGVISQIVDILKEHQPDLMHLNVIPFSGKPSQSAITLVGAIRPRVMDNVSFARIVHIYITFISGMIINKATLESFARTVPLLAHVDTVIPQLAWILDILMHGQRFVYVPKPLVMARREGSGGYNIYKTFSVDLVNVLNQKLHPKIGSIIKRRTILKYLPSLIVMTRKKKIGNFTVTREEERFFKCAYSDYASYWLLIVPLLRLPLPAAMLIYYASRLLSKYISVYDRIWAYRLFQLR